MSYHDVYHVLPIVGHQLYCVCRDLSIIWNTNNNKNHIIGSNPLCANILILVSGLASFDSIFDSQAPNKFIIYLYYYLRWLLRRRGTNRVCYVILFLQLRFSETVVPVFFILKIVFFPEVATTAINMIIIKYYPRTTLNDVRRLSKH